MNKEQREKWLLALKKSKKICEAISDYFRERCEILEDPTKWDKETFEIDGKASLKASKELKRFILKITEQEIIKIKKIDYR